jgi:hypothetical protein
MFSHKLANQRHPATEPMTMSGQTMKWLALAFLTITASADELPFDMQKPGLLSPGSVHSFTITPSDKTPKITIRYHADSEADLIMKTPEGNEYAPILKISATTTAGKTVDLPYSYTSYGVPHTHVADYDCDGFLDFRVISDWGTGGSWYCYYRFDGTNYVRWPEPEALALNGDIVNGETSSHGRSGPNSHSTYYQFKNGRFVKVRHEAIRMKKDLPEFKDDTNDDFDVVKITEDWKAGRLIRRITEPQYGK